MDREQGSWLALLHAYNPLSIAVGHLWILTAIWATRNLSQNELEIEEEIEEIAA